MDRSTHLHFVHFPYEQGREEGEHRLQEQQMDMVRGGGDPYGSRERTI